MKRHFYFSKEQKLLMVAFGYYEKKAKLNDGEIVEYTLCSNSKNWKSNFKDMEYLGEGIIYSIEGVIQSEARG